MSLEVIDVCSHDLYITLLAFLNVHYIVGFLKFDLKSFSCMSAIIPIAFLSVSDTYKLTALDTANQFQHASIRKCCFICLQYNSVLSFLNVHR